MTKRQFKSEWLAKLDSNNQQVNVWCTKKDDFTALCKLCESDISVAHMGFGALKQHSQKERHKSFAIGLGGKQTVLQQFFVKTSDKPLTSDKPSGSEYVCDAVEPQQQVWSIKQQTAKAEIIAAMQFASQNIPFSFADELAENYRDQFPDSAIASKVSIGSTKMSYIVAFGLGPYFTQQIIQEIKEGPSYFTLHFDETVTAQVKKQMDILVRFWSHSRNEVQVSYLTSVMFRHAKADDVVAGILESLEKLGIPLRLLLSLGMDGPNVNKAVLHKINDIKREKGMQELVRCPPSCLIHICHNSFHKGIAQYGFKAEELCLNLYYFFKRSSARRSDLFDAEQALGLDELMVLRHVQSRWLSLVPALERLVDISSAIKKLLLEDLPKSDKSIGKNDKYLAIKKALESKEVDVEIQFLISIKPIFDEFITKFQLEEPKIQELHPSCEKLLKVVMGRLLKNEVFVEKKGKALKEIDVQSSGNQMNDQDFKLMQGKNFFCI